MCGDENECVVFFVSVCTGTRLEPRNEANLELRLGIMYDPYMADVGVAYCTT